MLTPEQIDAALGALQQQIDDLRADTEPEPAEPTVRCGNCNAILTSPLDHYPTCPPPGQCTACNSEPAYWRWRKPWDASRWLCDGCFAELATHPDPAVDQLQRAVKQAGERLAELEKSTPTVRRRRAASATTSCATVWTPSKTGGWRHLKAKSSPCAHVLATWKCTMPSRPIIPPRCDERFDGCGKDIVTQGGICTDCPYAPAELQSQPKSEYCPQFGGNMAGDIPPPPTSRRLRPRNR